MKNTLKKCSIVVGLTLASAVSANSYAETAEHVLIFDAKGNFLIVSEGRVIGEGDSFTLDDSLNASKYTVNTELKDPDVDDDPPETEPGKPDPKPEPVPKPTCSGPFCPGGVPFEYGEEWTRYHPDSENLQLYQVKPETIDRLRLGQ